MGDFTTKLTNGLMVVGAGAAVIVCGAVIFNEISKPVSQAMNGFEQGQNSMLVAALTSAPFPTGPRN